MALKPAPANLPRKYRWHWEHPWTKKARRNVGFRRWLKKHGYLSPHFPTRSAHSQNGDKIPSRLGWRARRHAFGLEELRHRLGDKPLRFISYYRSPRHNRAVGGASRSRHMKADATDFGREELARHGGRDRVLRHAKKVSQFRGIGIYPSGALHLDSRFGRRVFWSSF